MEKEPENFEEAVIRVCGNKKRAYKPRPRPLKLMLPLDRLNSSSKRNNLHMSFILDYRHLITQINLSSKFYF